MATDDEQLNNFYDFLSKEYERIRQKYRQFCFLNHLTYSDDTLNDTVLKVSEKIIKDGLKGKTEKDIENYFFKAFKINTFQSHLKEQQRLIDDNIQIGEVELTDEENDTEEQYQFNDFLQKFLEKDIKSKFDDITFRIWRLRYFVTIDGKNLNYKQIKSITKIPDTRKRIVDVNRYIRNTYSVQDFKNKFNDKKLVNDIYYAD